MLCSLLLKEIALSFLFLHHSLFFRVNNHVRFPHTLCLKITREIDKLQIGANTSIPKIILTHARVSSYSVLTRYICLRNFSTYSQNNHVIKIKRS